MKVEQFKKLIEEAVRKVLKEELSLLTENKTINKKDWVQPTHTRTGTPINELKNIPSTGNTLMDLINETKLSGDEYKDIGNFDSSHSGHFNGSFPSTQPQVGTVEDMFASSNRRATNEAQVKIDVVPDYSKLMDSLKEKGQI